MTAGRRMKSRVWRRAGAVLLLALSMPALAQNSDAPVDVTAAPPASADTVGPAQLQNFNLQGTVTRPAERPAAPPPASVGTPGTAAADRASPTPTPAESQPATRQTRIETPRAAGAAQAGTDVPAFSAGAEESSAAPAEVALEETSQLQLADPADSDTGLDGGSRTLSWPWIAALLALIGGGAFIGWSRRGRRQRHSDPGRMAFAGLVPDVDPGTMPVPPAKPKPAPGPTGGRPAPRPDPVPPRPAPAPAPAPKTADDGLITSTVLKPELNVHFSPDRVVLTDSEALLQFDIILNNIGSAPARDVLVEAKLVPAHPGQDEEIAAFFQYPEAKGDRMARIPPFGKVALKSAVRLPIDQLRSFEVDGRKLFVPLVAFNILFRSNSGEGQASASFLVGRGTERDEKLAPFRLDLGPRIFRGLSARPHSMGLNR